MTPTYLHLSPGQEPPNLTAGPFRAIIIADQAVSESWLDRVAKWIVDSGCLYVVAWGVDCETWHDSVDWAVLEVFDYGEIPDERFIMTTWHNDEPMSEAFWFAGHCAFHPDVELPETLILHVASEAKAADMLQAFSDGQVMAGEA